MIKDYLNHQTVRLCVPVKNKEDAVREAAKCLVDQKKIKPEYIDKIFEAMETFGPYIVLIPGIALAHAEPGPEVNEECLSMITLEHPVEFGHPTNDPVKIVFVLASKEKNKHMEVLMDISKLLMEEDFIDLLNTCHNVDELLTYIDGKEQKQ